MASRKLKRGKSITKSKPKIPELLELKTGQYALEQLRQIVKEVVKEERMVTLTFPRSWCQAETTHIPILSPQALRYIDIHVAVDSAFSEPDIFVLETGKKKYQWKTS